MCLQKEEAELEKLREKERIRSGKELLEAKRKEDDLKLKRNLELRRIEKEEEQRARDKIRVKLGQRTAVSCKSARRVDTVAAHEHSKQAIAAHLCLMQCMGKHTFRLTSLTCSTFASSAIPNQMSILHTCDPQTSCWVRACHGICYCLSRVPEWHVSYLYHEVMLGECR